MKAFLAGAELPYLLTGATLAAKIIGLVFSLASGLSIGKEGPFVHVASCLAQAMFGLPWFSGSSVPRLSVPLLCTP